MRSNVHLPRVITREKIKKIFSIIIIGLLCFSMFAVFTQIVGAQTGELIGYWNLDEGSGNIAHDSSGNENDGVVTGAQWVDGISSSALRFTDRNTYVTFPFPSALSGNTEFTVSMWVHIEAWPTAQYAYIILFGDYEAGRAFHVLLDNDGSIAPRGTVRANFWDPPTPHVYTKNTFNTGVWYNWVFVYDKTKIRMYQNGTFLENMELDSPASVNLDASGTMTLSSPSGQAYNGVIDEVKIFDYARSEEQILVDYNIFSDSSSTQGDLVGYWNFDESSGTIATDSSGNGNTGSVSGAQRVDGINGNALRFDGVNDYVYVPHSSSLDLGGYQMTVEFWMKLGLDWHSDINHENLCVYDKGDAYTSSLIADSGALRYNLAYVPVRQTPETNKNTWAKDEWYFIAEVYDDENIKIYVNGVLDHSEPVTGPIPHSGFNLAIGAHSLRIAQVWFNGVIDEFSIYDYARSEEQILFDYNIHTGKPNINELFVSASIIEPLIIGETGTVELTFTNTGSQIIPTADYSVVLTFWDNYDEGRIDSLWLTFKKNEIGLSTYQLGPKEGFAFSVSIPQIDPNSNYRENLVFTVPKLFVPSLVCVDQIQLKIQGSNGFNTDGVINDVYVNVGYDSVSEAFETVIIKVIETKLPHIGIFTALSETIVEQGDSYTSKLFDACGEGKMGDVGANAAKLACVLTKFDPDMFFEEKVEFIVAFVENLVEGPISLWDSYLVWLAYKQNVLLDGFNPMTLSFIKIVDITIGFSIFTDPVNILVTDPLGRQSGFYPNTRMIVDDIPEAFFYEVDGNVEAIFIPDLLEGNYSVSLSAISQENYEIRIEAVDDSIELLDKTFSGPIKEGQILSFETVVKETGTGLQVEATLPVLVEPVEEPLPLDWTIILAIVGVISVVSVIVISLIIKRKRNKKLVDWYYEKYPKETN